MNEFQKINKWVIEDFFLLRTSSNVTSFSYPGLPDKIHFSLSHRAEDKFWNFHVSKNVTDQNNKPKIEICKIKQSEIGDECELWMKQLIMSLLEPIPFKPGRTNRWPEDCRYVDTEELQSHKRFARLRKGLYTTFIKHTKKTIREFRIRNTIQTGFDSWIHLPETRTRIHKSLSRVPKKAGKRNGVGMILTPTNTIVVLTINRKMYRLKSPGQFEETLQRFLAPGLIDTLNNKLTTAILRISMAETYQETEAFDEGIELFIREAYPH